MRAVAKSVEQLRRGGAAAAAQALAIEETATEQEKQVQENLQATEMITEAYVPRRELATFMRRPGQVLSQNQLLDAAWDFEYEHRSNVVEVYIRYLREKIDRPFRLGSLETVLGIGYRLRADGGG